MSDVTAEPHVSAEEADTPRFGSLGWIIGALMLCWSAALALNPLNDNSFFTHLATGRLILEEGSVPRADPYTFTAQGEAWTVQSWLASVAYAGAERIGGAVGLRLLLVVVFLAAALVLWQLTRPAASIFVRASLMGAAMLVVTDLWTERPYMVGVIGVGLVWLALEGRMRPWVLAPYLWVWTNTHGSFPLAIVLCLTVIAGALVDGEGDPFERVASEARVLLAVAIGSAAGALSPLGLRALTFPIRSITDRSSFAQIVEWRAPEFTEPAEQLFLVLAVLAIAAVVASARWRHVLPLLVFITAALLARRNLAMALPVIVAVLATAGPNLGTLRSSTRPRGGAVLTAAAGLLIVGVVVVGLQRPDSVAFGGYPASAIAFLDGRPTAGNVVTQDFTGNLLEVLDGPSGRVFIDDRADMFPANVLADYQTLNDAGAAWDDVLDRHDVSTVVWSTAHPLSTVLIADRRWMAAYSDAAWLIAVRR